MSDRKPNNYLSILTALANQYSPAPKSGLELASLFADPPPLPINPLMLAALTQPNALAPQAGFGFLNALRSPPPIADPLPSILGGLMMVPPPAPVTNALFGLGLINSAPPPPVPPAITGWRYVSARFGKFLSNIAPTAKQNSDGRAQQAAVISCLNRQYWDISSDSANAALIGSWGKDTRTRAPRDADILFLLPNSEYWRFQERNGNRQSQLLQDVKLTLVDRYPRTDLRGDGQVVMVPFTPPIEVVPAFRCKDGSIIICDANGGGRYKTSTSEAEIADLNRWDAHCNGAVRALVRMIKTWQREKSVDIKSFHIERLVIEFMKEWPHSQMGVYYYDWMIRDFLDYLVKRANGSIVMPGTGEIVLLGNAWLARAQAAHRKAIDACLNERDNFQGIAGTAWQDIFGPSIPLGVA